MIFLGRFQLNKDAEKRIEFILLKMKLITPAELEKAFNKLKSEEEENADKAKKRKIEDILLEQGSVTEFDLVRALGVMHDIPLVNLVTQRIPPKVLRYVPVGTAKKYGVIPVHCTEYMLYLATSNPFDLITFDKISKSTGKQVSPLLATRVDILAAIDQNYIQQDVNNILNEIQKEYDPDEDEEREKVVDLTTGLENNPIVRAVNIILQQAQRKKASDIHIEPMREEVRVRIRIDGILIETMRFSSQAFPALLSRIKVIASLDISEKRIPQDGRMTVILDDVSVNMRISTLPTIYGEKIVIRLLGSIEKGGVLKLDDLGFERYNLANVRRAMKYPSGIILFTGPTGSGKTTTVYGVLDELNTPEVNIITVEDPVEKMLDGISQVAVNTRTGLTFAVGLRSILRQDPDIIMIGEMRDSETTEIAARAAITGHIVVSTIHTNSASSTFMRMVDMGVEPFMVSSSVICVIAQRLVKKICRYCMETFDPTEEELEIWHSDGLDDELPEKFFRGRGCGMCHNTGYSGRSAVHEVVNMDGTLKELILQRADSSEIDEYLKSTGFKNLIYNGKLLVKRAITTLEELYKLRYDVD